MPTFYRRDRTVNLSPAQRTSLVNLLQSIFPGTVLQNLRGVVFNRDGGEVECTLHEKVQANVLSDIPAGVIVEQE